MAVRGIQLKNNLTMDPIKVYVSWQDNFGAHSEVAPGCVAMHQTLDGVKEAYASALKLHLDAMREDGDPIPEILQREYQLDFELDTQALLKHLDGKISRSALARITGINEKQLGHYLTGRVTPRPANRQKVVEAIQKLGKELLSIV
jgi:predicted RNase H-like HicB family nuclease